MRYIDRNNPPQELADWKIRETVDHQRHFDGSLPTTVKDKIRENRVRDQGFLCAYTMQRIHLIPHGSGHDWDAHLEHGITRLSSRKRGTLDETVDYRNLVACVDHDASLPYGAAARGESTELLPVSPFHPQCADRFTFRLTGEVEGVDPDAKRTIKILRLNHVRLQDLRKSAMSARGLAVSRPPTPGVRRPFNQPKVSATRARAMVSDFLAWNDDRLDEFCVALSQAAALHAKKVESAATKLRYARKS